ncbi:MAG: DUF3108 domain-containing protein [Nitrospirae bacterium]|nr:DUF3108 domain-containing protein [Nitrospirota bacterium]MDA1304247.1 DUF3108 domain-containing protein [Nitrospirota bacterium]
MGFLYVWKMQLLLCVLILGLVVLPSSAQVGMKSHPQLFPRESLQFGISLLGVPAGTATMDTTPLTLSNGLSAIQFNSRASSNDFISFFFPVNNVVNSTVDAETMLPLHLLFQRREGKRHEDFDITFDHQSQKVIIFKDGQTSTMAIPAYTHDGLSCLYYLRQMPSLDPGQSVFVTIHHDKNNYKVEVQVEAIERIEGPWGEIEAVRLVALMPFSGIFLNEGNIRFWLTNDLRRVPLKMSARVIVGSVEAVLENWPL